MTQSRGPFYLIVVTVLLSAAAGRGQDVTYSTGCSPPPEGNWNVVHNFPPAPGNNTLFAQARTVFNLRKDVIPGVYSGTGAGIVSDSVYDPVPSGTDFNYYVHAMFVEEICALSGALYDFEAAFVDPILWYYDGKGMMSGPYVNAANGSSLFTRTARHDLTYLGEL